ncbi:hypothetical protein HYV88_01045 [Candidatus Woesearchaeota archaeon]|nr:hypothetical protein [Candidatus Woesearchaeota archaeon]
MYEYLIGSLILLIIWILLFEIKKEVRKEMLLTSIFTAPLGLTEFIFVPEYWDPPTIFNLAKTTGLDIESLIFSFAMGGIASILYEELFKVKHITLSSKERKKHTLHYFYVFVPILVFLFFYFMTNLNPIYVTAISLFLGAIAIVNCRKDLKDKIIKGGFLFLGLYFIFFILFIAMYPNYVSNVWNFSAISGILIFGIPLEELMFAFTLGMYWAGLYEHINWKRVIKT